MFKTVFFVLLVILFSSCTKTNADISSVKLAYPEKTKVLGTGKIEKQIVNTGSVFNVSSASVQTEHGGNWFIGQTVGSDLITSSNVKISTNELGVQFGPIEGFKDDDVTIGWNNQRKVVFIEINSLSVKTVDGVKKKLGKNDVFKLLGVPFVDKTNQWRYQNTEFEVVGMIINFDNNGIVEKIIIFSYV